VIEIADACYRVLTQCAATMRGDWLDYIAMNSSFERFVQGAMARALNANLHVYCGRTPGGVLTSALGFTATRTSNFDFGLNPEWHSRDLPFGTTAGIEFDIELKAVARYGRLPVHADEGTIRGQLDAVLSYYGDLAVTQVATTSTSGVRPALGGMALVCLHVEVCESSRLNARWGSLAANAHAAATDAVAAWAARVGCDPLTPVLIGLPSSRESHHWEGHEDDWLRRPDDLLLLLAVHVPGPPVVPPPVA